MEIRRNYTVTLPSLQYKQAKSVGERGNCINLIIKHYEEGVLTPSLNKLTIGIILFSSCFYAIYTISFHFSFTTYTLILLIIL